MILPSILEPTYFQMLAALSAWLEKAELQMPGDSADALMSAKLAPDMFPLATQIRFACVQAQEGVFRLRGSPFPNEVAILLDEGRNADERPGSLEDARRRIAETIEVVMVATTDGTVVDASMPIAHALPQGMIFDLNAEQYVRDWALPQFYFHVMTAYSILRAQGINLGKADYVNHMFAYLRPQPS